MITYQEFYCKHTGSSTWVERCAVIVSNNTILVVDTNYMSQYRIPSGILRLPDIMVAPKEFNNMINFYGRIARENRNNIVHTRRVQENVK